MKNRFMQFIFSVLALVLCLSIFSPAAFAASKIKAPARPVNVKAQTVSSSTIKISWNAVNTAKGYAVYRSTARNGSYKLAGYTKNLAYTDKKLKASKTYYYRVKAYVLKGKKKVLGSFSAYAKATTTKDLMAYYKSIQGTALNKIKQRKLDNKVNSIINNIIKPGMTELEKANAIYNYILDNVIYEDKGWWVNNANHAYGALVVGRAQCSGYSRAFTLLCAKVGIETRYVIHKNPSESGHKWSMVKINGQFYHIDIQGADSTHDDPPDLGPDIDLHEDDIEYHLLGDENMGRETYKWDHKKYPKCSEAFIPEYR